MNGLKLTLNSFHCDVIMSLFQNGNEGASNQSLDDRDQQNIDELTALNLELHEMNVEEDADDDDLKVQNHRKVKNGVSRSDSNRHDDGLVQRLRKRLERYRSKNRERKETPLRRQREKAAVEKGSTSRSKTRKDSKSKSRLKSKSKLKAKVKRSQGAHRGKAEKDGDYESSKENETYVSTSSSRRNANRNHISGESPDTEWSQSGNGGAVLSMTPTQRVRRVSIAESDFKREVDEDPNEGNDGAEKGVTSTNASSNTMNGKNSQFSQYNGWRLGDVCIRKGKRAVITNIHWDTDPPSCDVQMTVSKAVVGTEFDRLSRPPMPASYTEYKRRRREQDKADDRKRKKRRIERNVTEQPVSPPGQWIADDGDIEKFLLHLVRSRVHDGAVLNAQAICDQLNLVPDQYEAICNELMKMKVLDKRGTNEYRCRDIQKIKGIIKKQGPRKRQSHIVVAHRKGVGAQKGNKNGKRPSFDGEVDLFAD